MPILYSSIPGDKKLNEIVFAGTHDAAITSGRSHVQTQNLDILDQAKAGVRIFDLRIAAAKIDGPAGQAKQVTLKAFHSDFLVKNEDKVRDVSRGPFAPNLSNVNVSRMKMGVEGISGGFGMTLERVLAEAEQFVSSPAYSSEFLILKFDKCKNWQLIADECIRVLGGSLYTGGGNLNEERLSEVAGKVIVLFTRPGILELMPHGGDPPAGIYEIRNLNDTESRFTYSERFQGLQYYGKGGTTLNPFKDKVKANEKSSGSSCRMARPFNPHR